MTRWRRCRSEGKRVQGARDLAGGLLQANTIPGSIIAPEAGEVTAAQSSRAASAVAKRVSNTVTHAGAPFDPASIQAPFQNALRSTIAQVAKDAGVTVSPTSSIRDVVGSVADAVIAKSRGLYQQLDAATGQARFQRFDDALAHINRQLRETVGLDDEQEAVLTQRKERSGVWWINYYAEGKRHREKVRSQV